MASINKRKTKRNGMVYDLRYRTPERKMKRETYRTRQEAEQRKADVLRSMSKGTWIDPKTLGLPFETIVEQWIHAGIHKRDSTKLLDASVVKKYILPEFGDKPIASINKAQVQAFISGLVDKGLTPGTIHRHFSILRAILNFAIDSDVIVRNPCRTIKLPTLSYRKPMIATPEQIASVANAMPERYQLMAWIASSCALRWGEVAALQVKHINFLRKTITVEQQVTRTKDGNVCIGLPKTEAGKRTLTIPRTLFDLLSEHFEKFDIRIEDQETVLFPNSNGDYLHPSNFRQRIWIPACKSAGIIGLRFHDLRSTNATMLVLAGVDIKTAQKRLGHASPRMTLGIYAQATQEGDEKAAVAVEKLIFSSNTA